MSIQENQFEVERQKKLNQAAGILADEIFPIRDKLEKAHLAMQEVLDEYFFRHDRKNKDDEKWIIYGFERATTFANIVSDYVIQAKEAVEILEERGR